MEFTHQWQPFSPQPSHPNVRNGVQVSGCSPSCWNPRIQFAPLNRRRNSLPPICTTTAHSLVQNSRFCACLRVVHKAESAITCHHTQLGAFLKSPAGAIYFKEAGNFCDSSCALGCFHLACRVQMFNDPRQKLQTGRQALFYHNLLCIAFFWSNGLYSPEEKQVVTGGKREGWPQEPAQSLSWRCMQN